MMDGRGQGVYDVALDVSFVGVRSFSAASQYRL